MPPQDKAPTKQETKYEPRRLSAEDEARILELNSTIDTVPQNLVQMSNTDVIASIKMGHQMNRLIRNEEGIIGAYLVCTDDIDGDLYVKYLFSNVETVKNLRKEIYKFINKARKDGYKKISFNGFNERLNSLLGRFGFKSDDNQRGALFTLDLENQEVGKPRAYIEWIKYLREDTNAKTVWESLSEVNRKHVCTLLETAARESKDVQIHNFYGVLDTLMRNRVDLSKFNSTTALIIEARVLEKEQEKRDKSVKFARDLLALIGNSDRSLQDEISKVIYDNNSSSWDRAIKGILTRHSITCPKDESGTDVTFTETFLFGLNRDEPVTFVANLESTTFPYTLYTLNSKEEMKKESDVLKHCVGDNDFYIAKVKDGKIKVISIRDKEGVPKWTIEYNIKNKRIDQFKGGGDVPVNSLPDNKELVMKTLDALTRNGYPVDVITESFPYSILRDNNTNTHKEEVNKDELLKVCLDTNKSYKVLKGNLTLDNTLSKDQVLKLCSIQGLTLDLTKVSDEIKKEITEIKGNLIDSSVKANYTALSSVGGNAYFGSLTNAAGLEALSSVGGDANFSNLTNAEILKLKAEIAGVPYFSKNISRAHQVAILEKYPKSVFTY